MFLRSRAGQTTVEEDDDEDDDASVKSAEVADAVGNDSQDVRTRPSRIEAIYSCRGCSKADQTKDRLCSFFEGRVKIYCEHLVERAEALLKRDDTDGTPEQGDTETKTGLATLEPEPLSLPTKKGGGGQVHLGKKKQLQHDHATEASLAHATFDKDPIAAVRELIRLKAYVSPRYVDLDGSVNAGEK